MIRDDPELRQTLVDLAPVYAGYRKAKSDAGKLDRVVRFQSHHAAQAHAADLLNTIIGRAMRFSWDPDGLLVILAAQSKLHTKLKRRPSIVQVSTALEHESVVLRKAAETAKLAADAAQRDAEIAARKADAAQAARVLYTGYSA